MKAVLTCFFILIAPIVLTIPFNALGLHALGIVAYALGVWILAISVGKEIDRRSPRL